MAPADRDPLTALQGQLIEALSACGGDIGSVLGIMILRLVPGSVLTRWMERDEGTTT